MNVDVRWVIRVRTQVEMIVYGIGIEVVDRACLPLHCLVSWLHVLVQVVTNDFVSMPWLSRTGEVA